MTTMVYLVRHSFVAILFAAILLTLAGCGSDQGASEQEAAEQEAAEQEAALEEETAPPAPEADESPPVEDAPAGTVIEIGDSPAGVVADPETGLVAVGLSELDRLALVDGSSGEVVREVELSASPRHLGIIPGGPVLVPAEGSWTLIQVSLPEGEVMSEIPVGAVPHDAAAAPDGRIFVINEFSESVSVIEGDEYLDTIEGAPLQLGGVAVTDEGLVGVIGVRGLAMEVYDADTLESQGRVDAGEGPTHIVAGPDNRFYVVDTRGEAIFIYDAGPEPEQIGRVPLPGAPYGVAIDPERGHLWMTLTAENEVVQLALEGDTLREIARYPTVRQPNTVAVDPSSGRVFVTGGDAELQILDPQRTS